MSMLCVAWLQAGHLMRAQQMSSLTCTIRNNTRYIDCSKTDTDEAFDTACARPFLARASILSERKHVTACSTGRTGEHSALRTVASPAASKSLSSSL